MNDLEVNYLATSWLKESNVLGRRVDIIMNDDGSLFVGGGNDAGGCTGSIMKSRGA